MNLTMKMCTLFLPEKWYDMLDDIIAKGYGGNRSEIMRLFIWKGLSEMRKIIKQMDDVTPEILEWEEKLGNPEDIKTHERRIISASKHTKKASERAE